MSRRRSLSLDTVFGIFIAVVFLACVAFVILSLTIAFQGVAP